MRSASVSSKACSSLSSRMKNCSTSSPPASHPAIPTMNGYVPVPPISPVVSVSRKSHCRGSLTSAQAPGASRRSASASTEPSGGSHPIASENHLRTDKCSPNELLSAFACNISASRCAPSGSAGEKPRTSLVAVSAARQAFRAGFSAVSRSNRALALMVKPSLVRSSRFVRQRTSRAQPLQNRQRRRLRLLAFLSRRPHARGAPLLTRTAQNQLPRPPQQNVMYPKQRLAEANPARIRIIQIQIRLEEFLHLRRIPKRGGIFLPLGSHARARRPFSCRNPQIPSIAHQQQTSHRCHRIKQTEYPILPIRQRIRQLS